MKIFLLIILNQVLMRNKRTGDYILKKYFLKGLRNGQFLLNITKSYLLIIPYLSDKRSLGATMPFKLMFCPTNPDMTLQIATRVHVESGIQRPLLPPLQQLALGNQWFPVRVWLLALCRGDVLYSLIFLFDVGLAFFLSNVGEICEMLVQHLQRPVTSKELTGSNITEK